jgi:lysophospholipase L1-like esterase
MASDQPSQTSANQENAAASARELPPLSLRRAILFAGIVFLAAFGAMEGVARLFVPSPRVSSQLVEHEVYGYLQAKYEPRDTGPKTPGEKRLLLLGDSFARGAGAGSSEDYFANVMERRLRDREPEWNVVNAGVTGWGPSNELLFLEREGSSLAPDVVLTQVFLGNDATDETGLTQITLFHGVAVLDDRVDSRAGRIWTYTRLHARLAYVLGGLARNAPLAFARHSADPPFPDIEWRTLMRRKPWLEGEFYSITRGEDSFYEAGFASMLDKLLRIAETSRRMGARPLFVLIPGRLQVVEPLRRYAFELNGIDSLEEDLDKFNRRVVPFLQENGCETLDLYPLIRERPAEAPLIYHTGYDDHFNVEGHRFAGEAVAKWLLENLYCPNKKQGLIFKGSPL